MARPTDLTKELIQTICGYIENGSSYKDSFVLAGVSETAFYDWKKRGNEDIEKGEKTIFAEFAEAIKVSRRKFKAYHIQRIMNASKNPRHWHASAWLLERLFHEEFGKKQDINLKGKFDVNKFDVELSPEEKKEYMERLQGMVGQEVLDEAMKDFEEAKDLREEDEIIRDA